MVWLKFLACVAIIFFSGTKLARYGDIIGERTGLGGIWIGLILLAFITTTPELVTGVSSATLVKLPNLAVGTLFGSCLFNLTIIAVLDVMSKGSPVLSRVRNRHMISAGVIILLFLVAALAIFRDGDIAWLTLGWIEIPSLLMFLIYIITVWIMFRINRRRSVTATPITPRYSAISLKGVYVKFALAALSVIGAGIWVSFIGDEIAYLYGWGATFVGSLFLAIATSMPELVVTTAALRLGAVDMAVADILGANMLDLANVFIVDLFYTPGPILLSVSGSHIITAIVVAVMSLIVIFGIRFKMKAKIFAFFSWYSFLLVVLYVFGASALFRGITLN